MHCFKSRLYVLRTQSISSSHFLCPHWPPAIYIFMYVSTCAAVSPSMCLCAGWQAPNVNWLQSGVQIKSIDIIAKCVLSEPVAHRAERTGSCYHFAFVKGIYSFEYIG